jgi:hypothetical protein
MREISETEHVMTSEDSRDIYRQSPRGRWSISVPVPESEHRHLHSDTREGSFGLFETTRLHVFMLPGGARPATRLSGPNIRQNGTAGALTRSRETSREDIMRDYPQAWEAAVAVLGELAGKIREDAELACAEIALATTGQEART